MIVPLIIAIWFGYVARKAGRSWLAWSIGGAVLAFIINTVLTNLGIVLLRPFTPEGYMVFRIVATIIAIAITALIGRQFMARLKKKAEKSHTLGTPRTDSQSIGESE